MKYGSEEMEKFGERIRELRKNRGLTIYELATRLGISRNTLTLWERGEKEPCGITLLEDMADVLQVPLKSLLAGERETRIEDNPIIKSLDERVARLEKIIRVNEK